MDTIRIVAFGFLGFCTCFAVITIIKDAKDKFDELCNDINLWQKKTFQSADTFSKWYHLRKEIDELFHALEAGDIKLITKELADCFILLIGIAGCLKINPQKAIKEKFKIIQKRKWGKPDKNGVVEHIRKGENHE